MSRLMKHLAVGLTCASMLGLGGALARGDSAAPAVPLAAVATGSITGTVTGVNGAASGVTVKVLKSAARARRGRPPLPLAGSIAVSSKWGSQLPPAPTLVYHPQRANRQLHCGGGSQGCRQRACEGGFDGSHRIGHDHPEKPQGKNFVNVWNLTQAPPYEL